MIFFPALRMQDMMRRKTFGAEKWRRIVDKFNANHKKDLEKDHAAACKKAEEAGSDPPPMVCPYFVHFSKDDTEASVTSSFCLTTVEKPEHL